MESWYKIVAKEKEKKAEVFIYDVIGSWGISASKFITDLKQYNDVENIEVRINSVGGDVFDGIAMYNVLKDHPATVTVYIDALAASIASVVAMAGDKIVMYDTSEMMIHKPWTMTVGNADQLRKDAEVLDKIQANIAKAYLTKVKGLTQADLDKMMSDETWMNGEESQTFGFADEVITAGEDMEKKIEKAVSNDKIMKEFKNIPQRLQTVMNNIGGQKPVEPVIMNNAKKDSLTSIEGVTQMTPEEIKAQAEKAEKEKKDAANASIASERQRVMDITASGEMLKIKAETVKKAIEDGVSFSDAAKVFHKEAAESATAQIPTIKVGKEDGEKFVDLCKLALEDASGLIKDAKVQKEVRGSGAPRGIQALARTCLERDGVSHVASRTNEEIAGKILNQIAQGTGDFTNILVDAINKNLSKGMQEAPTTYRTWTRSMPVMNFQTYNHIAMSNFSDVEVIAEGEKFQQGAFSDKKETGKIETYGKAYTISRQAIVNDDLNAFTRVPAAIGASIERKKNSSLYDLLISNSLVGPAMGEDSLYLFDATATTGHGNYVASGSGGAPSATTIGAGRLAMMTRKLLKPDEISGSQYTGIAPSFIIADPNLQTTIEQIVYTNFVIAGAAASAGAGQVGIYNPYGPGGANVLAPIFEPYLINADSGSGTGWYLAASPNAIDTALLLLLNGNEAPVLRSENSRVGEALGVSWDIHLDWKWMFGDWRGMYYNHGA